MAKVSKTRRRDFEQALGETFSEHVCPPIDFEAASPQECSEVVCLVLGDDVTPACLAKVTNEQVRAIADEFAEFFDSNAPTAKQIKDAIRDTLKRWPVGSLGEKE